MEMFSSIDFIYFVKAKAKLVHYEPFTIGMREMEDEC